MEEERERERDRWSGRRGEIARALPHIYARVCDASRLARTHADETALCVCTHMTFLFYQSRAACTRLRSYYRSPTSRCARARADVFTCATRGFSRVARADSDKSPLSPTRVRSWIEHLGAGSKGHVRGAAADRHARTHARVHR